jgi:hypothetical protein
MNNLGSHKSQAVRQLIRSAGAKLFFLPRYSPDLNPIEAGLRQAQDPAAQNRSAHHRGHLARHRHTPRPLQPRRNAPITSSMPATLQPNRITL